MIDQGTRDRVVRVRNLQAYFHDSINDVVARQRVEIDPHAAHYVVNLLTIFSRSNELYEEHAEHYGLRPLALMLAEAANTELHDQRSYLLQRIGDVALFIAGGGSPNATARLSRRRRLAGSRPRWGSCGSPAVPTSFPRRESARTGCLDRT